MNPTVTTSAVPGHLERLENGPSRMAKADLHKNEMPWNEQIGRAIVRCFSLAGVTQKEAAALLDRDPAQVGRWTNGKERPQLDALFAVPLLRQPLVIALAELAGQGVKVVTEIRLERIA